MAPRDDRKGNGPTDRTRRQWLLAVGAGAAAGLAGCSSDSGSSSNGDDEDEDGGSESTDSPRAGEGSPSDGGGSDSCPSSFSYVTQEYSAFEVDYTVGQCDVAEMATIQSTGSGFQARHDWTRREIASFGVTVYFSEETDNDAVANPTVEGSVESILNSSSYEMSRATDRYETATDGTVVLVSGEKAFEGDNRIPITTAVVVDHPDGVMEVNVGAPASTICNGASARIHRRLVESQRPV